MKLLLDNSIYVISKTHQFRRYYAPSLLGKGMVAHISETEIKRDDERQHKINRDIHALKILNESFMPKIQFYSYAELVAEFDRAYMDRGARYIFDPKEIQYLPDPLEKSSFFGVFVTDYVKKDKFIKFIRFLINTDSKVLLRLGSQRNFSESKMNQLTQLDELKTACKKVQETHYPDIFHLWTAACFNLDGFLTTDYKLCRLFRNTLMCPQGLGHPITPSELLDKLNGNSIY